MFIFKEFFRKTCINNIILCLRIRVYKSNNYCTKTKNNRSVYYLTVNHVWWWIEIEIKITMINF